MPSNHATLNEHLREGVFYWEGPAEGPAEKLVPFGEPGEGRVKRLHTLETTGMIDWCGAREQARYNRECADRAWLATRDGSRFDGDEGKVYTMDSQAFWPPEVQVAQQAFHDECDGIYDTIKEEIVALGGRL